MLGAATSQPPPPHNPSSSLPPPPHLVLPLPPSLASRGPLPWKLIGRITSFQHMATPSLLGENRGDGEHSIEPKQRPLQTASGGQLLITGNNKQHHKQAWLSSSVILSYCYIFTDCNERMISVVMCVLPWCSGTFYSTHPFRHLIETRHVWDKFSSLQGLFRGDKVWRAFLHHVPSTIHLHPATHSLQNTWRSHVCCLEQWVIIHVQQKLLFFSSSSQSDVMLLKKNPKLLAKSFQPKKLNSITRCGTWTRSVWSDGSCSCQEHFGTRRGASPASYCVFNARPCAAAPRRPCMRTWSFTPSPSVTLCEAAHAKSNRTTNSSTFTNGTLVCHLCCRQYL